VRKELVRPDRTQLAGDDAYRFRHLLIRDAAYDALPKATRADLHERFARWIEQHGGDLVELDEILGYHLGQACLYRAELGLDVDDELRADARRHLAEAGSRAIIRDDFVAAQHLIRRALDLVPDGEVDAPLEVDLGMAIFFSGRPEEGHRSLVAAAERAEAAGDRTGELSARVQAATFKLYIEPHGASAELDGLIAEVSPELEAAADDFALYALHVAQKELAHLRSRFDDELAAIEPMVHYAQRTGRPHLIYWASQTGGAARFFGSTPLADCLAWLDERQVHVGPDWHDTHWRSAALAMLGRFDEARRLQAEYHDGLEERGDILNLGSNLSQEGAVLELLAGDPAAAAAVAERGCRILEDAGERAWLSTGACRYAAALYELDRLEEAEEWAQKGADMGASDDMATQVLAGQVLAKVNARRGQHSEAERLAREAVAGADATDSLLAQGDARHDLAEVLELSGRREEATAALSEALERYERKGALVLARQVRERLAALEPAST
jgi:tetratricopeptide (TPR) repeat protein